MKWPRKKSMGKLKDTIRSKTRRSDGRSLQAICEDLNRTLRGWFEYFKHSKDNVFETVDGYTRGRLRSGPFRHARRDSVTSNQINAISVNEGMMCTLAASDG